MIGTLDVEINAANPSLPLPPFKAFVNSPSSIRVRNVPRKVGKWEVTKVFISVSYPDNSIKSAECVLTGGVWVGTIAGSTLVGRSANGYQITANGTDENGAAVSGYCLAIGDVEILTRDGTITIGETTYYVHICDTQPTSPKKGDLCKIAGTWKIYNGTAWDTLGGGGGGNITDVKVNGVSVVDSEGVALIDISGKADATALTAEVNRATAAEALKADQTALTAEVNRATAAEATKASAASLTAETNRATAAEALKRDKTDFSIAASPSRYVVTVPEGGIRTDQTKWLFRFTPRGEGQEPGYMVFYDGEQLTNFIEVEEHTTLEVTIDWTDPDYGKTYVCTWTSFASDTIAKTSEVNAGLATKVQNPTSETSADNGKYLQKTANGNVWATVQSGPSIVTSFPATPLDTNVPSTKLVKDSLDAKFDKAGGTISGDAYITGRLDLDGYLHAASGLSSGDTIQTSGLEVNEVDFFTWLGQRLADNTDDYSSSSSYAVGSFCKYDGALYVCKTAIGSGGEDWTAAHWTAMPNVSNLFSGDNTSLTSTIDSKIAAKVQNLDPDTASLADLINALKGNN